MNRHKVFDAFVDEVRSIPAVQYVLGSTAGGGLDVHTYLAGDDAESAAAVHEAELKVMELATRGVEFSVWGLSGRNVWELQCPLPDLVFCKSDCAEAFFRSGIANFNLGLLNEAAADFRRSLRLRVVPQTLQNLASVMVAQGRHQAAVRLLMKALALAAHYDKALFTLAEAWFQLRRYDKAQRALTQYLAGGYARKAVALNNLGVVLDHAGDSAEARTRFRLAIDCDPSLDIAKRNLARLEGQSVYALALDTGTAPESTYAEVA
ncbi:MAG: tetratricopeptide repeat protein [Dehalococcoidia bacterium]|nr:tetratricopeptide repeat protein [Dehalococcoidia bacterium]